MIELHDLREYAQTFILKAEEGYDNKPNTYREKLGKNSHITLSVFLDYLERDLKRADKKGLEKISCTLFEN